MRDAPFWIAPPRYDRGMNNLDDYPTYGPATSKRDDKKTSKPKPRGKKKKKRKKGPLTEAAVSAVLDDGSIIETVYRPRKGETAFLVWKDGEAKETNTIQTRTRRLVPYSPGNNLLRNGVLLLPGDVRDFGDVGDLVEEIQAFIHRYVDVSPLFERVTAIYVLLSWVYDAFGELPYLRLRGGPGTGKTRFLLTVGALCYKPIFASGASTVSPLFRMLDAIEGTLLIDEGDFLYSDERAEIVKILNNGNARGFPVLRSEVTNRKEFSPAAYRVYGPKLIATRKEFADPALESRCLTEEMGSNSLRHDVPLNLPASYRAEALELRNKLMMYRFRNLHRLKKATAPVDRTIEPRLAQVFAPLLAVAQDETVREELLSLARSYHEDLLEERGVSLEAKLLEVIADLQKEDRPLAIGEIAAWFADRHGEDYERVTPKWVGGLVRKRLRLKTRKSNGVYVIAETEGRKLRRLYERYGLV